MSWPMAVPPHGGSLQGASGGVLKWTCKAMKEASNRNPAAENAGNETIIAHAVNGMEVL